MTLTLKQTAELLQKGEATSVELTRAALALIESADKELNCFIETTPALALTMAKAADVQIKAAGGVETLHPPSPRLRRTGATSLRGVPLGIKDCFNVADVHSRSASKILSGYHSQFEGPAVLRIRAAGGVFVGKTNADEFTCGASTENSAYGPSRNPWDSTRVPGGSSGGSAAAVAAGFVPYALGTDTGGSLRQPASFCGVVGLKNTYGRVPRYGVMPMASSLDTVGAITRTVEDMAFVMNVIAGDSGHDATTPHVAVPDYTTLLGQEIRGLKIGIPSEYFIEGIDAGVEAAVRAGISELEKLGAEIVEVSLPHTKYAIPVYYIIVPSEVSSNMARFDGIRYGAAGEFEDLQNHYLQVRGRGFGDEMKRRIMLGTYALSSGYYDAYYLKAQKVRTLILQDFEKAFEKVDVIAAPTSPGVAFKIGAQDNDPLKMYLEDVFTAPINLAGIPSLNVPCGFVKPSDGDVAMPVGMQIIGPRFSEDLLLQVGYAYQQVTGWHERRVG